MRRSQLINTYDAATTLGITTYTLREWRLRGKVTAVRLTSSRGYEFDLRDVQRLADDRAVWAAARLPAARRALARLEALADPYRAALDTP